MTIKNPAVKTPCRLTGRVFESFATFFQCRAIMRTNQIFTAAARHPFTHAIRALCVTVAAAGLSACANIGNVIAEDNEGGYSLTATGISYTMSMAELTKASREKASAWCDGQDKNMQLRQQARGWRPMQVELSFRCLPRQPGELQQPASLTAFK